MAIKGVSTKTWSLPLFAVMQIIFEIFYTNWIFCSKRWDARISAPVGEPSKRWLAALGGGDMRQRCWRVDMMMEPGTPDLWIYKRDQTIQMARSDAVRFSKMGIPYLAPINVILFKAKHCREKDQKDFHTSISKFSFEEQRQLIAWLDRLHPGHGWIEKLRVNRSI